MPELNEQQIELISAYIKQNGVASNDLHDDLLDHVCTSIEHLMESGDSFEQAFSKTIKLFGPGGLKQVQQQTFELITEINETMKKVAFVFGLTSAILLLAGTIFKLLHWPGAGVLVVLGGGLLSLGYLPLLLFHKLKESPRNEAPLHVAGFVGLFLTAAGVMFKIMHWPGAFILLIGLGVFGLFYVPIYFYYRYKSSSNKPVTLSASLVAMTCLIMVFALINLNSSSRMDLALVLPGNNTYMHSKEVTQDLFASQDAFDHEAAALVQLVDQMSVELIMRSEAVSEAGAASVNLMNLASKYDHRTPTYYLFEEGDKPRIENLLEAIDQTRSAFEELGGSEQSLMGMMTFKTEDTFAINQKHLDWAAYHFYGVPMSSVLAQLGQIKLDVRAADQLLSVYDASQPAASDPPSGG